MRERSISPVGFHDADDRPWKSGGPYRYAISKQEKDSWHKCRRLADKYDDGMCAAWKEEVDKLLIFVCVQVFCAIRIIHYFVGWFILGYDYSVHGRIVQMAEARTRGLLRAALGLPHC